MSLDPAVRRFAAESLKKRASDLAGELAGVRAPRNIESVHHARVAARRLRVALVVFEDCFPRTARERWQRAIKRAAKTLGKTRDTDVQALFLKSFLRSACDRGSRTGVRRLLLRLGQARDDAYAEAVRAVSRIESGGILPDIAAACRRILEKPAAGIPDRPEPSRMLRSVAARAASERIGTLLAFDVDARFPERKDKLHEMRVAIKKLRYSLEIFAPIFGGKLKPYIRALRRFQDLLGALHDCDVWNESLPVFLERERGLVKKYFGNARLMKSVEPGIEFLLKNRRAERKRIYSEFLAAWEEAHDDNLWRSVKKTLSAPPRKGDS